ncbi:L,D-transpeptidase family protein [Microvirga arsenatis]|uniref:L,D-transpeptidase family protein n=1 Tax=Microvirga arsenatis TaxID=2692265 RepID=A0ABW9YZK2_9HYPH|nr:L,D-transpeptidase family protein [Microvirga arsenatis]NBJ12164.1 L,D-transpeptidase family protein [Microvirga arsenatis]NBJ25816.1 L,D-transpeptidase family protein [Microvirga arsenatis]
MRGLRKTAVWLGLIGSASLLPFSVLGQEPANGLQPGSLEPVMAGSAAEPSFHDVAVQDAGTPKDLASPAIPLTEPAPVLLEAADLKPSPTIDIPLPDAAPVTALLQGDLLRLAVESLFADDAAMREMRVSGRDREALSAYYARAERALVWAQDGAWSPAARAAMERLKAADEDGLDPADYAFAEAGLRKEASPAQWARADVKLSLSVVRYARDARGARIDLPRLSPLVTPKLAIPGVEDVLSTVSSAKDANAALAAYNPPHAGYKALKERLAKLRENHPSQPSVRLPKGPILRVGMSDPRVPLIRARFNLTKGTDNATVYDERVASAVAAFQKERGLPDTGVLNAQTVAALSGPSLAQRESEIIANMERWRWLPADLGTRHIVVNVPEYRLRLVDGRSVVHETRVIVGKEQSQTPIFSEAMKYLVVNPSWTIPPSIMKKEILPALASDPDYAARKGYRIIRRGDRITVQQPPGERNALGFVKFMFPNQHAVYLHDTPNRNLFSAAKRAFSHGCVRVDKPFELAEEIMGKDGKWTEEKLRGLIGKGERTVHLSAPLPVHLTYFTLAVDEKGEMRSYEDIYGLDRKVRAALNLQE